VIKREEEGGRGDSKFRKIFTAEKILLKKSGISISYRFICCAILFHISIAMTFVRLQ
jgi:hypothetical protein